MFEQNDTLFGRVCIRGRYIAGKRNSDGRLQPLLEIQIKGAGSYKESFLSKAIPIKQQDEDAKGTVEKAFIHDFVRSVDSGWTAEQIWMVERYGEENVLTPRVVVVTSTSASSARVLYRRG
ncbi:hypothetical protein N7478_003845 [Penicillium angulare]|uniref:uncharacterized protein n=1 Tax=Penicillium angulare TaxID=116970 RepID=UPI0025404FFE|nr:uncharacterized protein N7478_003845 [Penicillium angulare]KAJ5288159.1 hypothetical protein N7478_003845 [Penicillium angulare]